MPFGEPDVLKAALKQALGHLGFEIRRRRGPTERPYEYVYPNATYSPWNADAEFAGLYQAIRPFTLVDKYRCFELWQLVKQSAKLAGGALIEIGVWRGGTAVVIAAAAKRSGIKDDIFLCDTFSGVVKAGEKDSDYKGGEHADTSLPEVEGLLSGHNLNNARILPGIFPEETGNRTGTVPFRFCHIDVDVYQSAEDILTWIWPRMVCGGVIVYDDFGYEDCVGITRHVEQQFPEKDRLILHNLNGHAIVIKLQNQI